MQQLCTIYGLPVHKPKLKPVMFIPKRLSSNIFIHLTDNTILKFMAKMFILHTGVTNKKLQHLECVFQFTQY